MKKFKEWISESPAKAKKIGPDWNNKRSGNNYDSSSLKFLNSERGLERIEASFNKTPFNFRLYFLKQKGAAQHNEHGEVTPEELKNMLSVDLSAEDIGENDITIIFTGNVAAEKVPLTPWTIQHRIGHTIRRIKGWIDVYSRQKSDWNYWTDEITGSLLDFVNAAYNKDFDRRSIKLTSDYPMKAIVNILGTMRSARMKKINRPYEFIFECFAQYIMTGSVKLNRNIPKVLKVSRSETWRLDYSPWGIDVSLEQIEDMFTTMFNTILTNAQGKYFIM